METRGTLQSEELPDDGETATWIKEKALALHIPEESYADPRLWSVVPIFRVPNFLKETKNEKAFVPQIVSLGPYHSNRPQLSPMEYHKKRVLRRMMTRFNNMRGATGPDNLEFSFRAIEKIFEDVGNIKNSYDENIDCTPECLAVMLTLDGCFLLEILRTLGGDDLIWEGSDKYEPIFDRNFTGFDILNDILMLENQIPFTVLRKLLELELNWVNNVEELLLYVVVRVAGTRFYPFDYQIDKWSWHYQMERWSRRLPDGKAHHFLGLLHSLIVSPPSDDDNDESAIPPSDDDNDESAITIELGQMEKSGKDDRCIPCAVELSNVGIKFQRCNGGIKKIYFDPRKATIYLPPINVTDHTEVLFRNLIALEHCQASEDSYVTSYLSLMDNLIDTKEDVAVLRESEIVKNCLRSDADIAALFNGLCKGVSLPREDIFQQLQDDVMKHYKSNFKVWFAQFINFKVWFAQFIKDHVSSPWKFLAFLGAILALVLTLLQTIYSILAYYK